jgi:hypothetical protein
MCWRALHRRLRVFETNYGRDAGWLVERGGRCVAVLTQPRWKDMFWDRYIVEWITDDLAERHALESVEDCLWWGDRLKFRNRELGEIAEHAFAAGPPRDGSVIMRGLYLNRRGPWPWEWLLLWLRGWKRKQAEHL